jgi:hypothetical protein
MVLLSDEGLVEPCLVRLEIVPIVTQDRCTVRTVWNFVLVHLETMLMSVQERCTVCTEHTIGIEIILDALDGTPR